MYPAEFSLKDGMGTGGITAIVVNVADTKNRLRSHRREQHGFGAARKNPFSSRIGWFPESEVFTTDTHAVSAVVVGAADTTPSVKP